MQLPRGHVVACAASGRAALDHLATGLSVDLVLTDLGMPDMTGWAVAATVARSSLAAALTHVAQHRLVAP